MKYMGCESALDDGSVWGGRVLTGRQRGGGAGGEWGRLRGVGGEPDLMLFCF